MLGDDDAGSHGEKLQQLGEEGRYIHPVLLWKQGKCAEQGSVRPVIKKTTETQSDNLKDLKHLKWSAVSVDAALLDAEQQT